MYRALSCLVLSRPQALSSRFCITHSPLSKGSGPRKKLNICLLNKSKEIWIPQSMFPCREICQLNLFLIFSSLIQSDHNFQSSFLMFLESVILPLPQPSCILSVWFPWDSFLLLGPFLPFTCPLPLSFYPLLYLLFLYSVLHKTKRTGSKYKVNILCSSFPPYYKLF